MLLQIQMDNTFPWKFSWGEKVFFYVQMRVNIKKSRIWASESRNVIQEVPSIPQKSLCCVAFLKVLFYIPFVGIKTNRLWNMFRYCIKIYVHFTNFPSGYTVERTVPFWNIFGERWSPVPYSENRVAVLTTIFYRW